ncbi:Acetyltransferase [Nitrospira japonica]|uniref:Acetyltransferase n=1 Tax=Nitrospira japonica TaxID=1325564 RepID=A0A1W1I5P1_9BACT|nr:GNAT family protein [Nitrospira japonica]SLM48143.1 Acetyltransferase [Nitrospira japonica]
MALTFPSDARLKDASPVQLVLAGEHDVEPLRSLYRVIVEEGNSYPHDRFPDHDEFMDYWFRGKTTVAAYGPDRDQAHHMAGAFYLKPNWPGRAGHVANAGFIVAPAWRGTGLGWLLGTTMLDYARQLGYRSVIFNLVFSENLRARRLWERLGFSQLGMVPGAVRKNDGSYQDAIVMFRSLIDSPPHL